MKPRYLRLILGIPIVGFLGLIGLLVIGFDLGRHDIHPSALLDKQFPTFEAQTLFENRTVSDSDLLGEPRLVNVWASWCAACREEHSVLQEIAESGTISLVGINYKDTRREAISWLHTYGNPFQYHIVDITGDLGIELGVYGAPETFILDSKGVIRYKHVGPLTISVWEEEIASNLDSWN